MRTTTERPLMRFLVTGLSVLLLVCSASPAGADGASLAVRLMGGQTQWYSLDRIAKVSFGADTLRVITTVGTDSYALESIVRIDFQVPSGIDVPEEAVETVKAMSLFQNQPNPFSPETRIAFELPEEGWAELRIYAVNGRLVRTLVEEERPSGPYSARWDGCDDAGRRTASGVYFYTLIAPGVEESRKMILLR
jgi:hypothetical protein